MSNNFFEKLLLKVGTIKGVKINREDYLRATFKMKVSKEYLNKIISEGPIKAGISLKDISEIADQAIIKEATSVTSISAATGLFGGLAMAVAIPSDVAQFYGHLFRVIQKLMYLYGWQENVFDKNGNLDDTTYNMVILYVGVMLGIKSASLVLAKLSLKSMGRTTYKYVLKALFSKGFANTLIKKLIKTIGIRTTLKTVVTIGPKSVPLLGGAISGGITVLSFIPMSKKLKKYFEGEIELLNKEVYG